MFKWQISWFDRGPTGSVWGLEADLTSASSEEGIF